MNGRRNKSLYRRAQGEERPFGAEGGGEEEGEGRKPTSVELCYVPGTLPGTLHTLSHLTLRITLEVGSVTLILHIADKKLMFIEMSNYKGSLH